MRSSASTGVTTYEGTLPPSAETGGIWTTTPAEQWSEDPGWHFDPHACCFPFTLQKRLRRTRRRSLDRSAQHLPLVPAVNGRVRSGAPVHRPVPRCPLGNRLADRRRAPWRSRTSQFVRPAGAARLPCESDAALAATYRTRFFLRIAFADTIVLVGFVGAFMRHRQLGLLRRPWSWRFPRLLRAAPTRSALVQDQDELTARGCNLSLVAALRRTPPK